MRARCIPNNLHYTIKSTKNNYINPYVHAGFFLKKTSTDLICTVHIPTQKNFYIIFKFHENCKGLPYIQKKIFPRVTLGINDYVENPTENDQQLPLGHLSFTQRR